MRRLPVSSRRLIASLRLGILVNMSKYFYKDVKLIKRCKKCRVEYRPKRYSFSATLGLCWDCRRPYYKKWYQEVWKVWFERQTKEKQKQLRKAKLFGWKIWVMKNKVRRRKQALESYHRRKNNPTNKKRRHRATKIQAG